MSLLDRVRECHRWTPEDYRPFIIGTRRVGRIRHDFARVLEAFPTVFHVSSEAIRLDDRLNSFERRNEAVSAVLLKLHEEGEIPAWYDEFYPVLRQWGEDPVMKLERGAAARFGIRSFGVHMNGFVKGLDGTRLWVARRSMTRPIEPGKLDHLVAGGQPHGLGLQENLIKECGEEAGIAPGLAKQARHVSTLHYNCARPEGLRDDVVFCFDLELPPDFSPENCDGEVEAFYLWPLEQVRDVISKSCDFKFNCALAIIDFLKRHGVLKSGEQDYDAIAQGLSTPVGD